ncbi:hypothetical protein IWQ56_004570, partial [Coemansia nantahalensis]
MFISELPHNGSVATFAIQPDTASFEEKFTKASIYEQPSPTTLTDGSEAGAGDPAPMTRVRFLAVLLSLALGG